ncbi:MULTISPECIES: cytochrome P450 [unclassified Streptomyces]|uniref:cytochrome P450 family protein n=1 Tax=unclassified Streptomyces TaxID=2593676 RepID=UPI00331DD82C
MTQTPLQTEAGSADPVAAASRCTPEFRANPHPVYTELRNSAPVCPLRPPHGVETYLITRHDDARAALADPRLSKDMYGALDAYHRIFGDSSIALDDNMLFSDPPKHTRLRRIVQGAFTTRRVELLRPRLQQVADELLDRCATDASIDLLTNFAFPLPLQVICELLGVPEGERERAHQWATTVARTGFGPEGKKALAEAEGKLRDFLVDLVARKRSEPGDDLMSALVTAQDKDGALTDHELVSTAWVLFFAGHKTSAYLIGNAVYHLLAKQDQRQAALASPESLKLAIEEMLRFEGSVESSTFRHATEDIPMRGVVIPKGALVQIAITSANRDPEVYADPDRLDVTRTGDQTHLSFGHGPHYCIGAPLARLEMQVALTTLFRRYPEITLAVPPHEVRWLTVPFPAFRGLTELPVVLDPERMAD